MPSRIVNSSGLKVKAVGKVHPITGHESPEVEQRDSSTLYLTSALDGGCGWSTPRPGSLYAPEKTRYPLYRRLGGPQGRSGRERKISPPPPTGIRSPDRNCAMPALGLQVGRMKCIRQSLYITL